MVCQPINIRGKSAQGVPGLLSDSQTDGQTSQLYMFIRRLNSISYLRIYFQDKYNKRFDMILTLFSHDHLLLLCYRTGMNIL